MKKIKIIGFFILMISLVLIAVSHTISQLQEKERTALTVIEQQKSYTQDISKAVLYTQRHQKTLPKGIDKTMYDLFGTLHRGQADDRKIDRIGQEFYRLINEFKYLYVKNIPYYTTIMEKEINDIYKKSMELIMALNQRQPPSSSIMKKRYTDTGCSNMPFLPSSSCCWSISLPRWMR